jgi:hypothetical protein
MSDKYPKTPHFPFSPGISRDDRVNWNYWSNLAGKLIVLTEKLDGANTCLDKTGVYGRTHSAPTKRPETNYLKAKLATIANDLGNLEIFGENLFGIHSIEYSALDSYFYVFAARRQDTWLSWDEVVHYARAFGFPTVPVIRQGISPLGLGQRGFDALVMGQATKPSLLGGEREGLVARVQNEFTKDEFSGSVIKWVRSDHNKLDDDSPRNLRKARLITQS